ncbi:MAG TPA: mechanosensitive ion channel family protein [Caulobacter sp.]|nr:mechanosensitive ion channel family protein [Caulobacter sp.]
MQFDAEVDQRLRQTLLGDESLLHKFTDAAGDLAVNLVIGTIILVLTLWASSWFAGLTRRAMNRLPGRRTPDLTLQTFVASMVRYVILVVGFVAVLQQLGVKTTSIVAVLGAASLAVGLALQGALSNVAAGVMILLFRPYRVGDLIETGGKKGIVRALDLVITELATADNLKIVIPNNKVFGDVIVNHSHHSQRRVDVTFRIPAAADMAGIMAGVLARARANPLVLDDPEPSVSVTLLAEAAVEIEVLAWTRSADHAAVRADLLLTAKLIEAGQDASLPPLPKAPLSPPAPAKGPPAGRRSPRSRPTA